MPGEPMRRQRRLPIRGFDAAAITAARMLLGLTREELAGQLDGVSERTLGGWERGEVVPTAGKLNVLLRFMADRGVTPEDAIRLASPVDLVEQAILEDPSMTARDKSDLIRMRREMRDRRG